ncbi:MAG: cell division protein CrgA [Acidobacteria bacterium]|nr:cell division protein CrgA [Acidobacteriota bacterium]
MPESKSRRRNNRSNVATPANPANKPNPVWFKPVMFGLMLLGLVWIIVYYITGMSGNIGSTFPIPNIGNWNIAIGFGIAILGFLMTTRWRS